MSLSTTTTEFPIPSLTVLPWPDVVIDTVGHDPRSSYVERFWLGVLGPSATWFVRRLADGLEAAPEGYELDLATTALELGLGARGGRHAPFMRTIERCCRFGATELRDSTLRVRRKLPPLTRSQLDRLPERLRVDHQRWVEVDRPESGVTVETMRQRARQLALSLLELGEDGATAERQLFRWHVHPAMAHEATAWAVATHRARTEASTPVRPTTPPPVPDPPPPAAA
jgi:hypothetical protein